MSNWLNQLLEKAEEVTSEDGMVGLKKTLSHFPERSQATIAEIYLSLRDAVAEINEDELTPEERASFNKGYQDHLAERLLELHEDF